MTQSAQSIIDSRRSRQRKAAEDCKPDDIWKASQAQGEPPFGAAKGFTYPLASKKPDFFVKYTATSGKSLLEPEGRNQKFAFDTLRDLQQKPSPQRKLLVLVPEIYRIFEHRGYYYLVMEFVPGKTLEDLFTKPSSGNSHEDPATLYKRVADAIRLLLVKAPPGAPPGPVGGGIIRHPFFSDYQSTISYKNVGELKTHLDQVLKIRWRAPNPPSVTLGEELQFYYSDLSGGNFIYDTVADRPVLYIVDFDEAGFLPPSFMTFAFHEKLRVTHVPIAKNIRVHFPHDKETLAALQIVSNFLWESSRNIGQ